MRKLCILGGAVKWYGLKNRIRIMHEVLCLIPATNKNPLSLNKLTINNLFLKKESCQLRSQMAKHKFHKTWDKDYTSKTLVGFAKFLQCKARNLISQPNQISIVGSSCTSDPTTKILL